MQFQRRNFQIALPAVRERFEIDQTFLFLAQGAIGDVREHPLRIPYGFSKHALTNMNRAAQPNVN